MTSGMACRPIAGAGNGKMFLGKAQAKFGDTNQEMKDTTKAAASKKAAKG